MHTPTFVGPTIAVRPIAKALRAADPAACPRKGVPHARPPRSRHRSPPKGRHPDLAGAHRVWRLLRHPGVPAMAPVLLHPGPPRLRGEPEGARTLRYR